MHNIYYMYKCIYVYIYIYRDAYISGRGSPLTGICFPCARLRRPEGVYVTRHAGLVWSSWLLIAVMRQAPC